MNRIGIYAGSFNPIHKGHLEFAKAAYEQCKLKKVFFMVEPRPRLKQGVKALEHRQEMVRLATEQIPPFGTIVIDQTNYTVSETLPYLMERFKGAELYLLFGDDVLSRLVSWPNVSQLITACKFVIGRRKKSETAIKEVISIIENAKNERLSYSIIKAPQASLSSSAIRRSIRQTGQASGVELSVIDYIMKNGLYKPL